MCPLSVDQYNNTGDWLLDQHRLVPYMSCFLGSQVGLSVYSNVIRRLVKTDINTSLAANDIFTPLQSVCV